MDNPDPYILPLEKEVQGLRSILSVSQVVVSSLEMKEVVENVLYSAMTVMDMPAGSVALFDESSRFFHLKTSAGLGPHLSSRACWPLHPGGLAHRALERGGIIAIEDARAPLDCRSGSARQEGVCAIAAVPLKIQQKILGILYLDDFKPRRFHPDQLKAMTTLASFASMSIEHARLHEYTCQLASTDGLTGLYNYRMFRHMVKDELSRMSRYHKPMSLILFDIDNFKLYNDSFGHPAGDKALRATAEVLREALRECDILFRCGGEEFVALLPETDIEEALVAAERSRHAIEEKTPLILEGISDRGLTVSIGVAAYPRDGHELESLLQRLDDHLYMAKRRGKNLVHYLKQSLESPFPRHSALPLG
jgi:diguanylate cyclase (GGDEF)-like protein